MSEVNLSQRNLDVGNAAYWNELCGSSTARRMGISGNDVESLRKFDAWFFEFYPYLDRFIGFGRVRDRRVLEVGLGYGSVAQRLAENGADFTGLDISAGPVEGVMHRLRQNGLQGRAQVGSILAAPFEDETFDVIVAIGCLHHTGDLPSAIAEVARLLKPGGRATIMVYNAASYMWWYRNPRGTWAYCQEVKNGRLAPWILNQDGDRGAHDRDSAGNAPPETALVSKAHFARLLAPHFEKIEIYPVNIGNHGPLKLLPRSMAMAIFGSSLGLDLYALVEK